MPYWGVVEIPQRTGRRRRRWDWAWRTGFWFSGGLLESGYDPGEGDGLLGAGTRAALREWQLARDLKPTGYLVERYGHWLQLSVFQCRLTARRRAQMTIRIEEWMKPTEDHILILDLGPADKIEPRVESLGKSYEAPTRQATIV